MKYPHYDMEVLRFQNPISKFQTSISTFRRYRRFFGNHDIEYSYVDIEVTVTVFDIEKNVDIVIFDINVNVDIGGGKVPGSSRPEFHATFSSGFWYGLSDLHMVYVWYIHIYMVYPLYILSDGKSCLLSAFN